MIQRNKYISKHCSEVVQCISFFSSVSCEHLSIKLHQDWLTTSSKSRQCRYASAGVSKKVKSEGRYAVALCCSHYNDRDLTYLCLDPYLVQWLAVLLDAPEPCQGVYKAALSSSAVLFKICHRRNARFFFKTVLCGFFIML